LFTHGCDRFPPFYPFPFSRFAISPFFAGPPGSHNLAGVSSLVCAPFLLSLAPFPHRPPHPPFPRFAGNILPFHVEPMGFFGPIRLFQIFLNVIFTFFFRRVFVEIFPFPPRPGFFKIPFRSFLPTGEFCLYLGPGRDTFLPLRTPPETGTTRSLGKSCLGTRQERAFFF